MLNLSGFIIYGMLLSSVVMVTRAGNHLFNDTCQTVLIKGNATKMTAEVSCSKYVKVFDPKHQNGIFVLDKDTHKWTGEIFACLCSCQLPVALENGQIMSKNRSIIFHGETLDYSCNDGYEKNDRKIGCYDGLLMAVSDYFDKQHINISFRQKSIPESFARDEVFHLVVNKAQNLSVSETEVRSKQKVFDSHAENDTLLFYYMFIGPDYAQGFIDVEMGRKVLCTKIPASRTRNLIEIIIPLVIIVILVIASLAVALYIIKKRRLQASEGAKPKNQLEADIKEGEKQPMQKSEENGEDEG
ncbi:hypothetical protein CHS0354_008371 [Potamilus streckersoni]|uniref:Uncharacterized protein n=1 Tax=Potamilus streckersoni TaxID=2493646 RepID=A0AAE0RPS2_9BIVA|nr:hypothetical protein CHS0354_008371 [Potamilus streckersoni]